MITRLLVLLIRVYRSAVSPWLGPSCRYLPTCSQYSMECIERHGALAGSWYSVKRICRCHPWGGSGWDPPPDESAKASESTSTRAASHG